VNSAISISGLHAAQASFDVMADNVANLATEGFRPRRVELRPLEPRAGVEVAGIEPADQEGTDLATEMVGIVVAKTTYAANARAVRAEDDTLGALFDERA